MTLITKKAFDCLQEIEVVTGQKPSLKEFSEEAITAYKKILAEAKKAKVTQQIIAAANCCSNLSCAVSELRSRLASVVGSVVSFVRSEVVSCNEWIYISS